MPSAYRADHVGSLLRPPELLQARQDQFDGKITAEQLKEVEDACVLQALDLQKQAGISVFTEGEYRRAGWSSAVRSAIDNLAPTTGLPPNRLLGTWQGPHGELANQSMATGTGTTSMGGAVVADKIRQVKRLAGDESAFLGKHAPGPWKITMPGPYSAGGQLWREGFTDRAYVSKKDFMNEIAGMLKNEIALLIDEGCSYIQLDSLHYVERITDKTIRQRMIDDGEDPDAYLDDLIAADNAVLEGAQRDNVTVGMHMCRGNNRSAWHAEGATRAWPRRPSTSSTLTASCSNTTRTAPAASSPCASCPRTRWSSSA